MPDVLAPIIQVIAVILLVTLPVFFLHKTGVFAWMVAVMRHQDPRGELGVWLFRLFVFISLTSLTLTIIFVVFAILWHDADLAAWVILMAPLEFFVGGTAYCGWKVKQAYDDEVMGAGDEVPTLQGPIEP